jgi:predicted dehydrogenase
MNRVRPSMGTDALDCAFPPPREGLVLVESLRCFIPEALFASRRRSRVARVLTDYPGAGVKLVNYVLREGLASTMEKTRTKLDQQRVRTDLAMSAVGVVADAPAGSGLTRGDIVACGGFLLPVAADAYLLHPDQCLRADHDADGLERHFWLGALIRIAGALAEAGARSIALFGLGALEEPLSQWLKRCGLIAGAAPADAALAGSAFWTARTATAALAPIGYVLDAFGVCTGLPSGWRAIGLPDPGHVRVNPLDRRPLAWPFPFEASGREEAMAILLAGSAPPEHGRSGASRPGRVDLSTGPSGDTFGISIVGCGNFARAVLLFHALRVQGVRLRGVCDIRPEVAAVHARALGAAFHTADFGELLVDTATQAILVTTDHGSHAEHVAAALDAGKAVHVEKPPAVVPEQLTLMLEALARSGGTLTVGYNRPYAPAYPVLMSAIDGERGPIAATMIVKGFKLPPEHWYYWPGQGTRLAGNLVHWIDLGFRIATPARPVSVHVMRDRARHPADAADAAVIAIRFDDSSLVSIAFTSAGDDLRGVREWIEIGRGGTSIRIEDFDRLVIVRGASVARRGFGRDRGHAAEIRDVVGRLRARSRDTAMIADMIATSAILFAAQRSFDSGRQEDVVILDAWRPFAR